MEHAADEFAAALDEFAQICEKKNKDDAELVKLLNNGGINDHTTVRTAAYLFQKGIEFAKVNDIKLNTNVKHQHDYTALKVTSVDDDKAKEKHIPKILLDTKRMGILETRSSTKFISEAEKKEMEKASPKPLGRTKQA